ncbi:MAG: hypothetical protein LBV72_03565 [Tannerella sp.]|nr:hypothetical protein [Tannerella sp.]
MTIRILLIMALLINIQVCYSQSREENNQKAAELLGNLYKEVKYHKQSVSYFVNIHAGLCAFELWVNDMPVERYNGSNGAGTIHLSAPINTHILKSGVQNWELKLYPPVINGVRLETLPESIKVELSVEALQFDDNGSMRHLSQPVSLFSTSDTKKNARLISATAGRGETIYRGTFEAKIPYKLTGWSESEDLTQQDSTALITELIEQYETFCTLLEDGKTDEIARLILRREQETAQSLFYNKAKNDDYLQRVFMESFALAGQKPYPLEKYKMVFYGNGRMVTLERTDMPYEPALATKNFNADGKEFTKIYYLYFHKPKGSDKLEIIR